MGHTKPKPKTKKITTKKSKFIFNLNKKLKEWNDI